MRFICKSVSSMFAVVLAIGAIGASSAFASPEWYAGTPVWQQAGGGLSESTATVSKGTVKLTDTVEGVSIEVECEATGGGTAGPGAADTETALTMSKCVVLKIGSCVKLEEVKALHLPWKTELADSGGTIVDVTTEDGKGLPGFKFTCNIPGLGKVADECTAKTLSPTATNVAGGVDTTFAGEKLNCSLGGTGSGKLEGAQLVEATKGGKLEAAATGVFNKLTGPLAVKGTGSNIKIEDTKSGGRGATCQIETEGTIAAAGKGTITHYSASNCKPSPGCSAVRAFLPVNLPWNTELYETAGTIRDRIVSGGSGTPEWQFECDTLEGYRVEKCGLNTSLAAINGAIEGAVILQFDAATNKTGCGFGGAETGQWQGEFTIAHPAGVGAIEVKK